ncbi:MAG TPA: chromosome segregation protein SMC [Dermatophilaceae bacterium]|nr:chromosome segregation protein SMC [Dermatophilaceae bacterium]
MFLKSLTLRGFKSFASATTLRLEPGITCIVGPNGSGKSNVVDALAWVMGEQGAKSLRGGKMEDVIFAGTAGRPPLGRAEVALTIDNTDGALPIEYAEVTISRTMFRAGVSEYAINGTTCRLLDVQELLSDSGIGREMHVIVGQGQLDAVLRATPEERRGFIEEAAGVLKHRKRKERALRKLEAMDANLTRVADLVGEIRRQLGPLGRQAEAARQAAVIQADARDARLRLLADDLVGLTSTLEQEVADETALLARRAQVESELEQGQARLAQLELAAADAAPALSAAAERWYALSSLQERVSGTASLAAERARLLVEDETTGMDPSRDPELLLGQARQERRHERDLAAEIEQAQAALAAAVAEREALETAYGGERERLSRLARAAADRREGLARLAGEVGVHRSRIEAAQAELARVEQARVAAVASAQQAEREFAALEASIAVDEEGEEGLDAAYESAVERLAAARVEVDRRAAQGQAAERERAGAAARLDALEPALRATDGAAYLLANAPTGVLGPVSGLIQVEAGYEVAVAAALGLAADALVVASQRDARDAVATLRERRGGRAALLLADPAGGGASHDRGPLPPGVRWAHDVVRVEQAGHAASRLLSRVALVPDAEVAEALVAADPRVTAVTADGDVYAVGYVRGGSQGAPSLIETQAEVERTKERLDQAEHRLEQARFAQAEAAQQVESASLDVDRALERLHESDARMAALAERLGLLGATLRGARGDQERLTRAGADIRARLDADSSACAELEQRLAEASQVPTEDEPTEDELASLAAAASTARAMETEQRLLLRTREERMQAVSERAVALEAAAAAEAEQRARAAARRERRAHDARVAAAVERGAAYLAVTVADAVAEAAQLRAEAEQSRARHDAELRLARDRLVELAAQLRELTDSVHQDEVARAQQRLRIEELTRRAVEELGVEPDVLVAEFGPDRPVPVAGGDDAQPFQREVQEKRLRAAERKLAQLGRVNPLALEEYAALEERHKFLTEQLDDLRRSKRDLLDIVSEVDERVRQVFAEAYADTAAQFEVVFERLFPGGAGRLVLTDPGDLLTSGIEVEARPPGKKIKRLSLLSGGERSLTAVALLVAIFKARPSPFYIMDEVEAALDDTNLGRLLTLFEELRDSSQLVVITHQKRTMEIADALYGVSMRGDGMSAVVSQRLRQSA